MTDIRAYISDSRQLEPYTDILPELINRHYKTRYQTLKMPEQKMGMLAAGAMLSCFANIGISEKLLLNENGKPYVKEGLHFSISHSDSFTILAVSRNSPVGIDIERIGRVTPRIINKVSDFDTADASEYELACEWTRVEAALKLQGTGFYSDPMKLDKNSLFYSTCVYEGHCVSCALKTEHSFSLELAEIKAEENKLIYTTKNIFRKEIDQ